MKKAFISMVLVIAIAFSLILTGSAAEPADTTDASPTDVPVSEAPQKLPECQQNAMLEAALAYLECDVHYFGIREVNWCAYFTSRVAYDCGLGSPVDDPEAGLFPPYAEKTWEQNGWAATSIRSQIEWMTTKNKGTLYYFESFREITEGKNKVKVSKESFRPVPGDLVYLDRPYNKDYLYDHVAIVYSYDPSCGKVTYIGGNQGDMDLTKSRVTLQEAFLDGRTETKIAGYLRPNYTTEYIAPDCGLGEECPTKSFTDVEITNWFHDDLDFVMLRGLFNGVTDTEFYPARQMNRAMMVSVLYRLEGSPDVSDYENPFDDIYEDTWCLDAVKWAAETKVTEGVTKTEFCPNRLITRAQAAKMLYQYALWKGWNCSEYADFDSFIDKDAVGEWAQPAMHWALGSGMLNGTTAITIDPNSGATRAQLACIFARYLRFFNA